MQHSPSLKTTLTAPVEMSLRALLTLISMGHGATHWYAGMLSTILPLLAKDLGLSYAQVGLLMTGRALLGACGNMTTSVLTDLGSGRKAILLSALVALALCYALVGLAPGFLMVVFFGSLAAMSANSWHPPAMSLLGERFATRRGYALGWHGTGANLGETLSPLVVGAMLTVLPWRHTLMINVLPGLGMAALLLWLLPQLEEVQVTRQAKTYWRDLQKGLLQNPALLRVSLLSALRTVGQQCLQTFLPLYMAYELGFSTALVGVGLALMSFSGSLLEPLSGLLSDRVGRKPILFVCLFLSALVGWGLTRVTGVAMPLVCISILGFLHFSLRPIIFAFAMDVTPPGIGASTVGFVFTMNQICSAMAPALVGYLADLYGLRIAFYIFTVLTLLASLSAVWIKRPPAAEPLQNVA